MALACILGLIGAGCSSSEQDSQGTYLNAGSAPAGTGNEQQAEKMGLDGKNMAGDVGQNPK